MLYSETLGRRSRSDRFRRKRGVCIQKRWGGEADQIDLRKTGCCIQKRWGGEADQIDLSENGLFVFKSVGAAEPCCCSRYGSAL